MVTGVSSDAIVEQLQAGLSAGGSAVCVEARLPRDTAQQVLAALIDDGVCSRTVRTPREYRTSEAASLLGVSRPHLSRLINAGRIPARKVGAHWRIAARDVEAFQMAENASGADAVDRRIGTPTHTYPAVYRDVLFGVLDGDRDRFFAADHVSETVADREALSQLIRGGAVIEWGDGLSLGQPHKALMVFAATELDRPRRRRWSPAGLCDEKAESGELVAGSAPVVLRHFGLDPNPIGALPDPVWHGNGPSEFSDVAHPGWTAWVDDGITGKVPLAVAYADLFCVSDWRAGEFANYTLRALLPPEG
ncbi:MAG: helix-turn-helix domain-containing protein [Gordonia amarae]